MLVAAFIGTAISACAPPTIRPASEDRQSSAVADQQPASFPDAYYREAAAHGEPIFQVDPARSRLVIEVRRGGAFAAAGHDHVIASHDVMGFVAPTRSRADLYVKLDRLTVDEPALRAEAGFDEPVSEAAVEGTRANMLARVIRADRYPFAMVSVTRLDADGHLDASITLNGVTRAARIPVEVQASGDDFRASGALALEQTDFGITPLSLFGGAIQVQNRFDIRFSIGAHRMKSTSSH